MERLEFLRAIEEKLLLEPEQLKLDTIIKELDEWDSLGMLEVIALIDEKFGITLSGTEILDCQSFSDLIDLIESRTP